MEPKGYSKESLMQMRDNAKRTSNTEVVIKDTFGNLQLIAYQILHDKYGFGQKRIIRVENTIKTYLKSMSNKEITMEELAFTLQEKYSINTKNEANLVPFNERFILTTYKSNINLRMSTGLCILEIIYNYFTLLGVCLKYQFKFSNKQILEAFNRIRYYINTLFRVKQFELTMKDIALCLLEECNYCDNRYIEDNSKKTTAS